MPKSPLTDKLAALLQDTAELTGSFHPDALHTVEAQMTPDEFDTARAFFDWLTAEGKTFGHNLPDVFAAWQQSLS